jgi:putative ABC transport system substrate-binding protein
MHYVIATRPREIRSLDPLMRNLMLSRRRFVRSIVLAGCTLPSLLACSVARRPHRVGLIIGEGFPAMTAAFRDTLRELGYVEGKTLVLETRLSRANTPDLPALVAELARLPLDVIVAASLPVALGIRKGMPGVPMVIATCPGMISNGFAQSLERPGGNVTGLDELPPDVTMKRLQLLRMAAPRISRVALLSTTPGRGGHETQLAEAQETAAKFGVTVKPYRVASRDELHAALPSMLSDGMDGLLNFQGALSLVNRQTIVDFAAKHRIPGIYQATLFAEAGGLMTWAPDINDQFRAAARYVDKILKGARAGDLPIQHPSRYYLTLNATAARGLGLTLPPELLAQADRIVD